MHNESYQIRKDSYSLKMIIFFKNYFKLDLFINFEVILRFPVVETITHSVFHLISLISSDIFLIFILSHNLSL